MEEFHNTQDSDGSKQRFSRPLPPLPRHAVPYPWEDLSSLLCRVTRNMGYPDPHWILHPRGYPDTVRDADLPFLFKPRGYSLFQQQLLLDEATLSS